MVLGASQLVTAGCAYTMKYRFSDQLFKLPADKVKTPSGSITAKLRNLSLFVDNTGYLAVKVSQEDRATQTSTLGSKSSRSLVEDDHRFPVYSNPKNVNIDLKTIVPTHQTSNQLNLNLSYTDDQKKSLRLFHTI